MVLHPQCLQCTHEWAQIKRDSSVWALDSSLLEDEVSASFVVLHFEFREGVVSAVLAATTAFLEMVAKTALVGNLAQQSFTRLAQTRISVMRWAIEP